MSLETNWTLHPTTTRLKPNGASVTAVAWHWYLLCQMLPHFRHRRILKLLLFKLLLRPSVL